jgi:catechol 2,3-dioxygenase-like lactoylglutathione lyase family enzyme
MNEVQVERKSYQMPPQDGFTVAHFLTVADIERSARFYETVFGGRILSRGDSSGAPGYIQIANTWLIVNVGGGPTPDKPSVTLSVPADPDSVSRTLGLAGRKAETKTRKDGCEVRFLGTGQCLRPYHVQEPHAGSRHGKTRAPIVIGQMHLKR